MKHFTNGLCALSLRGGNTLLPAALVFFICLIASVQSSRAAIRTVDNISDTAGLTACTAAAGDCSLRGAISGAAAGDTINFVTVFSVATQTISLSNGHITIDKNLTVTGPGANLLIVQSTGATSATRRIFNLTTGTISISGMTISGGNVTGDGGGIFNTAITTLTGVVISGNTATGFGGGIESSNNLIVINSTISGNRSNSTGGCGGGIDHFGGTLTITNTTISGNSTPNSANNQAGGVGAYTGTVAVSITNSTITNNNNGGNGALGAGGYFGTSTMKNTIVAANVSNTTVSDIRGAVTSAGNNLIGNPTGSTGLSNGVNGDQVGTAAAPINPRLAPLGNYGGGIFTHALLNTGMASTAINTGTATGAPATDSRGAARSGAVDIGAFETNAAFTAVLPPGRVGVAYNQTITPESGAFTYTQSGGMIPAGLFLLNTALQSEQLPEGKFAAELAPSAGPMTLQGTPTIGGTSPFSLNMTNGGSSTTIAYSLTILVPTAAHVSVGGRVLVGDRGLQNAKVYLTTQSGEVRSVTTGTFGYYKFDAVAVGEAYVIAVVSKRYQFASQILSVTDEIADFNFYGESY